MIFKPSLRYMLFIILLLFPGCGSFQVRGEIQSGREALLLGRSEQALGRFQRAAKMNPHYLTDFTAFEEGVWTYVGRAHYQLGELDKAGKALRRAREAHKEDHLAHVYLGLVLMRQGQKSEGFREATVGLHSLKEWLRDMDLYDPDGHYWDPGSVLENEIDNLLAMIDGGEVRWQRVAPSLEWLGIEFEEEIDRAWEDQRQDDDDDGDSQK